MNKEEMKQCMIELGSQESVVGYSLFVEMDEGFITYWYREDRDEDEFYVEVGVNGEERKSYKEIYALHHKDNILAFGIQIYGEMMYELGKKDKITEIKKVLSL